MGTVDRAVLAAMAANPQTPPAGPRLGPVPRAAPEMPYHPAYHPFSWRGWVDFGVGAIGDMGAHLIDQPFWALGLDASDERRRVVDAVGRAGDANPAQLSARR